MLVADIGERALRLEIFEQPDRAIAVGGTGDLERLPGLREQIALNRRHPAPSGLPRGPRRLDVGVGPVPLLGSEGRIRVALGR